MDYSLCEAAIIGNTQSLNETMQRDPLILDKFLAGFFHCENPLHVATSNGHTLFVKELLGLKPELAQVLDSQQRSALHLASAKGHHDIVKELTDVSPEMCLVRDRDGNSPLYVAAMKDQVSVLELLVQTNPEAAQVRVDRNETILHLCVKHDKLNSLRLLLDTIQSQAFINAKDNDGNTILHLCAKHNKLNSLLLLLDTIQSQALVNAKDNDGNTILHIAILEKRYEIVKHVLRNVKIDTNERSGRGQTAMDILFLMDAEADQGELDQIKDLLRRANALRARDIATVEWISETRDILMVVASLMATMAFQAGLNPPGSFWQDNSNGHRAGEPIMASRYEYQYLLFQSHNTIGFVASLTVIMLLLSKGIFSPNKAAALRAYTLVFTLELAVASMALTYITSIFMVIPETELSHNGFLIGMILLGTPVMASLTIYALRSVVIGLEEGAWSIRNLFRKMIGINVGGESPPLPLTSS